MIAAVTRTFDVFSSLEGYGYWLFARMLASPGEDPTVRDPWVTRMCKMPHPPTTQLAATD